MAPKIVFKMVDFPTLRIRDKKVFEDLDDESLLVAGESWWPYLIGPTKPILTSKETSGRVVLEVLFLSTICVSSNGVMIVGTTGSTIRIDSVFLFTS